MTIPISKLNCLYCKKFEDGRCSLDIIRFSEERPPEKEYCIQLFRNFKAEQELEKDALQR